MQSFFFTPAEILAFAIVLFRVGGVMVFAPFFSMGAFPRYVKVIVPLIVALTLSPAIPETMMPADFSLGGIVLPLLGEALIGIVLGLAAAFTFGALQLAGQVMGFQVGFSIVNIIDPQTQVKTSVISILYNFLGLSFFLLINGHHWFFLAVGESFHILPFGGVQLQAPLMEELLRLSSHMFVMGVQIAAPVIAVTICSDVVIGIIGRAAPQINILIVGMPVKTLVGLSGMSIAFYFLPDALSSMFLELSEDLMGLVRILS
jgi:flagellar biosynthetic protein FliR